MWPVRAIHLTDARSDGCGPSGKVRRGRAAWSYGQAMPWVQPSAHAVRVLVEFSPVQAM